MFSAVASTVTRRALFRALFKICALSRSNARLAAHRRARIRAQKNQLRLSVRVRNVSKCAREHTRALAPKKVLRAEVRESLKPPKSATRVVARFKKKKRMRFVRWARAAVGCACFSAARAVVLVGRACLAARAFGSRAVCACAPFGFGPRSWGVRAAGSARRPCASSALGRSCVARRLCCCAARRLASGRAPCCVLAPVVCRGAIKKGAPIFGASFFYLRLSSRARRRSRTSAPE